MLQSSSLVNKRLSDFTIINDFGLISCKTAAFIENYSTIRFVSYLYILVYILNSIF